MKKATRKQEVYIIEQCMLHTNKKIKLRTMIMKVLDDKKLISKRINTFAKNKHPEIWQWQEFLITLKLGWRRYFYACKHKDSVFCKIYLHEKKSTKNCECCLYWRGMATGFLLAIVLYSIYTIGKFLL